MAKTKNGSNPEARKCLDCGAEVPSKFALKERRWSCSKVRP